ncbi:DegV family protein [Isobaculum melis]|uniref:EDD domain protein, DegV family n=1 Tax=Isobaculum melis TaxID=142588 RepID=A0A1H9R9G7_9LACT|nr:DegV family protein [Isobaculum melis]SER69394.1 EDD domain protein, DegV family [Isobaculum melis]
MTFKMITDSCCDLPASFLAEHDIDIVSMIVTMDNKEYIDDMGKTFDVEWFYQQLKEGKQASTSQINLGTYYETFKPYVEQKMPVLYLAFSSALSGSYNNALAAVQMLKDEFDQVDVVVLDTKAACLGEGMLVYEAALMKAAGKSREEVMDWLAENAGKVHSWVTVDDLNHLERGGRISKTAAAVGSLLNVKPIIVVDKEGALISVGKARGRKKSIETLIKNTIDGIVDSEKQTLFVGHVGVPEDGEYIKERLAEALKVKEIIVLGFGPTIAAHTGFGSLAVFSFGKER